MNRILAQLKMRGRCVRADFYRHLAFYDIKLEPGASVRKFETKAREIALGLQCKTVPIVKTIPELGIVRLHVATRDADPVPLWELYSNESVPGTEDMLLPLLLGENDQGDKMWVDMARNPHLLVAGSTGSGKTVLLHNIINNAAILDALGIRPMEVYLVDPKGVEFPVYEDLRFVMTVTQEYDHTLAIMEDLLVEMESRYKTLRERGRRSVEQAPLLFPSILLIIDEVAELMLQDKGKGKGRFHDMIVKLAQKARAVGIYLVLATQRPSTDVLTGLIKANCPGRIACKTASQQDSRVILDMNGAESLLGRGDAVLCNMDYNRIRFQVAFADPDEIVEFYKHYTRPQAQTPVNVLPC
jgi:S-DNA-T family DNA segregation ATPase FtsK/SpoIIIE